MSATIRWASVAAGVVLLVGLPTTWFLLQPDDTAGELPPDMAVATTEPDREDDLGAAGGSAEPPPAPEPDDAGAASDGEADAEVDAEDAEAAEEVQEVDPRPAPPVNVSLPSIGVDAASVVDVALDENGAVEIPDDVREVGWYRRGPRPGEDGNAFMTSHVDSRTQGRGVLFDLRRVEPGDPVQVEHEDGTISQWEVVRRERITKGAYPMEQVFRFDGPPGLVIDTCGGEFDPATGSYESIDIIYAVPADA